MGKQMQAVMRRREALLAEVSSQREQLAELNTRLQPVVQVADQAVLAGRFLRSHPVLVAGVAGLLVVRRKGLSGLVKTSWGLWRAYRYFNDSKRFFSSTNNTK